MGRRLSGYNGTTYSWGTSTGQKCSSPHGNIMPDSFADTGAAPAQPGNYLSAAYTGNYLNWYFGTSPTSWGAGARRKPGTLERIEIARTAAKQLVDSLINVRMDLRRR